MRQIKITNQITERTFITEKYFNEVSSIPMIDHDKEVELAIRIKKGDKKAEEQLIIANLRFVISCAKQYQNRGLSLEDLIAEGNLGLIKAAQRFDETRGFKFISYAVNWVRQSILESLHKNASTVRIPSNKILQKNKLKELIAKKSQEHNGNFSVDEVCKELGIDQETYAILSKHTNSFSIDSQFNQDSETTYLDILSNQECEFDNFINVTSRNKQLLIAFKCLSETEKMVLNYYYGMNKENREMTLSEISERMEFSSERIRQIKNKALKKLKHYFTRNFKEKEIYF